MKNEEETRRAQELRFQGPQPGAVVRHYKSGDEYLIVNRAVDEETLEQRVVYVSLKFGWKWDRKLSVFEEEVLGTPRFSEVSVDNGTAQHFASMGRQITRAIEEM